MAHLSYSRNFKGVADVFLRSPKLYKPLLGFFENVMVGESELSKEEREIIATHVSRINGCHFCVEAHRATLTAMGVDEATVSTLEMGPNIDGVNDQVKDLLVFSEKLTRTPAEITIADIDALKDKGGLRADHRRHDQCRLAPQLSEPACRRVRCRRKPQLLQNGRRLPR